MFRFSFEHCKTFVRYCILLDLLNHLTHRAHQLSSLNKTLQDENENLILLTRFYWKSSIFLNS